MHFLWPPGYLTVALCSEFVLGCISFFDCLKKFILVILNVFSAKLLKWYSSWPAESSMHCETGQWLMVTEGQGGIMFWWTVRFSWVNFSLTATFREVFCPAINLWLHGNILFCENEKIQVWSSVLLSVRMSLLIYFVWLPLTSLCCSVVSACHPCFADWCKETEWLNSSLFEQVGWFSDCTQLSLNTAEFNHRLKGNHLLGLPLCL